MDVILPMLNDISIIVFDLLIFTKMVSLRRETVADKLIMYVGCLAIIAAYFVSTYVLHLAASVASTICMSIPSFVLFFVLSKHRDARFLMTFCFVDTISLIIAFLGRYAGVLAGNWGGALSLIVTVGLFLVVFVAGKPYFKRYHELLEVVEAGWGLMAASTVLIYFALVFSMAYPKPLIDRVEYGPSYMALSAVVVSNYVVYIASILKTKKIHEQNKRLEQEARVYQMAYKDALTGTYNRAAYMERLNNMEREREQKQVGQICCISIDINNFKQVNDQLGHHMGDKALQYMANVLLQVFQEKTANIFRLGGDEFAVLWENAGTEEVSQSLKLLKQKMDEAGDAFGRPLSAAVGYEFLLEGDTETIENTFVRADKKMYQNKKELKHKTNGTH